ncbi:MAG: hypothetical protein M1840_000934 [Geoglossum simile]|nr:MAG: hypothetical protein M1840_000934 [Geoglossum simile]
MKFSSAFLALILPLAIAAAPTAEAGNDHGHEDDYHMRCYVWGEDARYRSCPKTSCDLKGRYYKGHWEDFYCYKWGDYVHGNNKWYKDSHGYYSNAYWWGSCQDDGHFNEC